MWSMDILWRLRCWDRRKQLKITSVLMDMHWFLCLWKWQNKGCLVWFLLSSSVDMFSLMKISRTELRYNPLMLLELSSNHRLLFYTIPLKKKKRNSIAHLWKKGKSSVAFNLKPLSLNCVAFWWGCKTRRTVASWEWRWAMIIAGITWRRWWWRSVDGMVTERKRWEVGSMFMTVLWVTVESGDSGDIHTGFWHQCKGEEEVVKRLWLYGSGLEAWVAGPGVIKISGLIFHFHSSAMEV